VCIVQSSDSPCLPFPQAVCWAAMLSWHVGRGGNAHRELAAKKTN
jgi:hypothetical protein